MKMITIKPVARAVQFWHIWLNQLHEKCLTGVKVQNSPYQQCRAAQVMSLFWFSSSILNFSHILPLSSTPPCSPLTVFPSGVISPYTAHESYKTTSQRKKESLSPCWVLMLGMRAGCCTRGKREGKQCLRCHTHSCLLRICEICVLRSSDSSGEWNAKLLPELQDNPTYII